MTNYTDQTIAVFGDSILYGSGNNGVGVGEYLCRELGCKMVKYCVGGARVGYQEGKNWLVEQVRQAIADGISPAAILFDGFTNDCYKTDGKRFDVPLGERGAVKDIADLKKTDDFSVCFEGIVNAFRTHFPDAKVVFVRPHRMGRREIEAQIEYGERAAEICRDYGVAVADIFGKSALDTFDATMRDTYTCDSYGWGRGDATHPNAAGYERFYLPLILEELRR